MWIKMKLYGGVLRVGSHCGSLVVGIHDKASPIFHFLPPPSYPFIIWLHKDSREMNYAYFLAHWEVNEKLNTTYMCDCTKHLC